MGRASIFLITIRIIRVVALVVVLLAAGGGGGYAAECFNAGFCRAMMWAVLSGLVNQ
ncbi:MAG: hypothetical protein IPO69_02710 [Saprospiraceae bacterium]|nr:hypothetical protein [Saprospiraceae bacterium]